MASDNELKLTKRLSIDCKMKKIKTDGESVINEIIIRKDQLSVKKKINVQKI